MSHSAVSDLCRFLEQPIRLPALPQTVLTLLTKARDRRPGGPVLLEAVGFDPVLVALLLKIFSSPASGYPEPSKSIRQDVDLIDQGLLGEALLSLRVETKNSQTRLSLDSFRKHAIACAVISELLATRLGYPAPGDAFLGGLIHDIGKIILSVWNPAGFDTVMERSQAQRLPALPLEEALLGIGHPVAGRLLMEHWNAPAFLAAACDLHHHSFSKLPQNDQVTALPAIVQQADRLCHLWDYGGHGSLDEPQRHELCALTRLSAGDFCELFLQASGQVQQLLGSLQSEPDDAEEGILEALWRQLAEIHAELSEKNRELQVKTRFLACGAHMLNELAQPPSLERTRSVIAHELGDCFPGHQVVVRFQAAGSSSMECWGGQHPDHPIKRLPSATLLPEPDGDSASPNQVCLPLQSEGAVLGQVLVDLKPHEVHQSLDPLLNCLSVASRVLATAIGLESREARGLAGQAEEAPASVLSPHSSSRGTAPFPEAPDDRDSPGTGSMVLVVEDDQVLRRLLIEILRRAGYQTDDAEDGLSAIRKLIESRYLAAILDLQMPHIDGLEVLMTSRRIDPNMPIVVLTGIVGPRGMNAARDAGAFRCLQKPAPNDEILQALAEALASRADTADQEREASA